MRASAPAHFHRTAVGADRLRLPSALVNAVLNTDYDSTLSKQSGATLATLAAAGVPYGVFDAASGSLWWTEQARSLLSLGEQRELERYLGSVANGSMAVHACVVGGRLEPAVVPRVQLAISAHPEVTTATVIVLTPRPPAARGPALDRLSGRERAVADLIARGESTKCIAAQMGISEHTARRHTEHLFTKLGVRSRAAVAAMVVANTA